MDDVRRLLFTAGMIAERRGLADPQPTPARDVAGQGPAGPPLVVVAESDEITADVARTLAALAGAGRAVLLVTDAAPEAATAAWLPRGVLHVLGEPGGDGPAAAEHPPAAAAPPTQHEQADAVPPVAGPTGAAALQAWARATSDRFGRAWLEANGVQGCWVEGFFNVEGGWAGLGTGPPSPCPLDCDSTEGAGSKPGPLAAHSSDACPACGRSPANTVGVLAGTGDGTYPVVQWRDHPVMPALGQYTGSDGVVGYAAWFATELGQAVPAIASATAPADLPAAFDGLFPVILGEVECDGRLHFADLSGSPANYTLEVDCPPDRYLVVGWSTLDIAGSMGSAPGRGPEGPRVQVLAAVRAGLRESLRDALTETARRTSITADSLRLAIVEATTAPDIIHSSHVQPETDKARQATDWVRGGGRIE